MISDYKIAIEELLGNQNIDAQQFFVKNGSILEEAYCELLNDNLTRAKTLFLSIKDLDIRAHWALIMISMIEGSVSEYPTYFELRNFVEIDLNILIKFFKGDYVENILKYSDFMFTINPESYKFIGRVLYNNGFEPQSMFFLSKAKNYFFNDPELHYLIAYVFYHNRDYIGARKSLLTCLKILPGYFPASSLLKQLDNV